MTNDAICPEPAESTPVETLRAPKEDYVSTTNACKACSPLGAAVVFRGIEHAVPFLHGSQGCATYMRRYLISHFREPMDIASSSLGEKHAVYGGGPNLKLGVLNVMKKYGAKVVGVATTCLTETIGDDVPMIIHEFKKEFKDLELPELVWVSTPSYQGSHMEGFHAAVRAVCDQLPEADAARHEGVNLLPGFVSPEDIRHLRDVFEDFGLEPAILPDYSDTLDAPALADYEKIPSGGLPMATLKAMSGAQASVEFGSVLRRAGSTGATVLEEKHGVPGRRIPMPVGLRAADKFFKTLEELSGRETPARHARERGRLVDAMVDGHKYLSGKRAVVYAEEDLLVGLVSFLTEIGIKPVLVASGGEAQGLPEEIERVTRGILREPPKVMPGVDFYQIGDAVAALGEEQQPELVVGSSKGLRLANQWNAPLIRVGYPVHDRFGAQRLMHVGYRGTQQLFDRIVNAVIEKKQNDSPMEWGYV